MMLPQSLFDAMAALGWREPVPTADAKAEIAALDQSAALRPEDSRRTTLDDIRRRIAGRNRLAEAPHPSMEMPTDEIAFAREAARADTGSEKLQLPQEVLEQMRRDQERAERLKNKDAPEQ